MTKQEYERKFRESPEELLSALHAIKSIVVDLAHKNKPVQESPRSYTFIDTLKAFGATMMMSKDQLYN